MNKTKQEKTSIDKGRIALKKFLMHQETGFLCDLYFVFYLKFNYQRFSEKRLKGRSGKNMVEVGTDFYDMIQLRFGDIPEDLFVFFRAIGTSQRTFLASCYLKSFETDFYNKYNIEHLQQELADSKRVIQKMIAFYFDAIDGSNLDENSSPKETVFDYIKESDYSNEEKIKLYEFFVNPTRYVLLLQRTLTEKQSLLSDYYKEHYKDIIDIYDPVALNRLHAKTNNDTLFVGSVTRAEYVSYCLLDRLHFERISNADGSLYVLGDQYEYVMHDPHKNSESCLDAFCHALCERNRLDILNLLYEQRELTCKDLERYFDFSGSTAYHHLSIMNRAGLVQTRSEGKTLFYSIDKQFINEVIEFLKKYIRG